VQATLDTDGVADAPGYQYLVDIEPNPAFSGFASSKDSLSTVQERLQQYADETLQKSGGTWVAGARIVRKSALVKNWPSIWRNWNDKYAAAPLNSV
jgi:hypothetical protein